MRRGQPRRAANPGHSGQALVLFALTMVLLVLMVLLTLGISARVRDKVQLQTLADTAAYSEAVVTARTYNGVSLLNRTIVSNMVALTGVTSLASWASVYYSSVANAQQGYQLYRDQTQQQRVAACAAGSPYCRCLTQTVDDLDQSVLPPLNAERERLDQIYQVLRKCGPVGGQGRAIKYASGDENYASQDIFKEQRDLLEDLEGQMLKDQALARQLTGEVARGSPWPNELGAPLAAGAVSLREVLDATNCPNQQCRMIDPAVGPRHMILAAMGTRGSGFITGRAGGTGPILAQWQRKILSRLSVRATVIIGGDSGSGYWNGTNSHASGAAPNAGADDHLFVGIAYTPENGPCAPFSRSLGASAWVTSGAKVPPTHFINGVGDDGHPRTHVLGNALWVGPYGKFMVWPFSMLYNTTRINQAADAFGQPKLVALVTRDFAQRTLDPWQITFGLHFATTGTSPVFDNRGLVLKDGTSISRQAAIATGIAYHHRYGHAKEPPNFLNPFWRATLVASDIDAQSAADVPATLTSAGFPEAGAVYSGLRAAGFKGTQ